MSDGNDAPNVKIIPPLIYLAGIVIGFLASILMPTKVIPWPSMAGHPVVQERRSSRGLVRA
jgi:hypothetical protein